MFNKCIRVLVWIVLVSLSVMANAQSVETDAMEKARELIGYYSKQDDDGGVSQLDLRDDGSFEWSYSSGEIERYARGIWGRESDHLVLKTDLLAVPSSVFPQPSIMDWTAEAEMLLLEGERSQEIARIQARCPFLAPPDGYPELLIAAAGAADSEEGGARPGSDASEAARLARSKVLEAVASFEDAARDAMLLQSRLADAKNDRRVAEAMHEAREMKARYEQAKADADRVRSMAGLAGDPFPEPELPVECRYPLRVEQHLPREEWVGGYAVSIGDPRMGLLLRDVNVMFEFDDGRQAERITNDRGWAAVRLPPVAGLRRIRLQLSQSA